MLKDILDRIEQRLAVIGLTPTEASRQAGLTNDAIRNLRRRLDKEGAVGISTHTLVALARVLGASPSWLLEGIGPEGEPMVAIVGKVGAAGDGVVTEPSEDEREMIGRPPGVGSEGMAVEVDGHGVSGYAEEGTVLFFGEPQAPEQALRRVSLVRLADGRLMVTRLTRGPQPGVYDLDPLSGAPLSAEVEWAAPIAGRLEPWAASRAFRIREHQVA